MGETTDGKDVETKNSDKLPECAYQQPRYLKKRKINVTSPSNSPPGRNLPSNTASRTGTVTYNRHTGRFDILQQLNDDQDDPSQQSSSQIQQSTSQSKKKNFDVPPIVLHRITDINKLKSLIDKSTKTDDYVIALGRSNTVRIKPKSMEIYKKIIDLLKKENLAGYTFTPKSEAPFRVVIKGIHPSTDTTEIEKQITDAGHQIHGRIVAARHQGRKEKPMPIHFVSLKKAANNSSVYDIRYLCNFVVRIEPPRKINKIAQCQRCQAYGHTKVNCFEKPLCVKCGGPHLTTDCDKGSSIPKDQLCCALCSENHPANYRGCRVYRDILERRKKARRAPNVRVPQDNMNTQPSNMQSNLPLPPLPPGPERSTNITAGQSYTYSEAAKGLPSKHSTEQDTTLNNFIMQQTSLFQQVLTQLTLLTTAINKLLAKIGT